MHDMKDMVSNTFKRGKLLEAVENKRTTRRWSVNNIWWAMRNSNPRPPQRQ